MKIHKDEFNLPLILSINIIVTFAMFICILTLVI